MRLKVLVGAGSRIVGVASVNFSEKPEREFDGFWGVVVAPAALATLRQTGMVTSLAMTMAVAEVSLPREDMMKLFVGTNITMGSTSMLGNQRRAPLPCPFTTTSLLRTAPHP